MIEYRFIEPLDILYLRGNKLFGDAGAHGSALMPPWPSLAAGALRAWMLVANGCSLTGFAVGEKPSAALGDCLGTPFEPGRFQVKLFTLARQTRQGGIEACFPLPADTVVMGDRPQTLRPTVTNPKLQSSYPLSALPALCQSGSGKPEGGYWLNAIGLEHWLKGRPLAADHLVRRERLWQIDPRLGIAIDPAACTAVSGKLYTAETVALCDKIGFLVGVQGVDGLLPATGLLRFGGDGRGARLQTCNGPELKADWERIEHERRFRLLLATPGLFASGWHPPGLQDDGEWHFEGGRARLVSAVTGRPETVSGWDLAQRQPKPAERVVPVASVYWFQDFEGTIEALQDLVDSGLPCVDASRRAEGFNNVLIGAWST